MTVSLACAEAAAPGANAICQEQRLRSIPSPKEATSILTDCSSISAMAVPDPGLPWNIIEVEGTIAVVGISPRFCTRRRVFNLVQSCVTSAMDKLVGLKTYAMMNEFEYTGMKMDEGPVCWSTEGTSPCPPTFIAAVKSTLCGNTAALMPDESKSYVRAREWRTRMSAARLNTLYGYTDQKYPREEDIKQFTR